MASKTRKVMLRRLILLVVLGAAACVGCHGDVDEPVSGTGPTVLFDLPLNSDPPRWGEVPYPIDLQVDEQGYLAVQGIRGGNGLLSMILETGLASLKGFGTTTASFFWLDGELDPSSLPTEDETTRPGSSVFLVNVDPLSPAYRERHPVQLGWSREDLRLSVLPVPGIRLEPKTTYAIVVRTALWGPDGSLRASPTLEALLAGETPAVPSGAKAHQLFELLARALEGEPDFPGGKLAGIAGATIFTTQQIEDDLLAILEAFEDGDPAIPDPAPQFDPTYVYGIGGEHSLDELLGLQPETGPALMPPAHDQVATVITRALYRSPRYLTEDPLFFDTTGGTFAVEQGRPVIQGAFDIPFSLVLPRSDPPPTGYPVVMVQHGLGGSRATEICKLANQLCAEGYVIAAMDAAQHGDRYDISNMNPVLFALLQAFLESTGIFITPSAVDLEPNFPGSLEGPDGWPDGSVDGSIVGVVAGMMNYPAFRDNIRQTIVDQMQFVRMLSRFDEEIPGVGRVTLDGDRIQFYGKSFGAVIGASFIAIEPRVRTAVLVGGGGGIGLNIFVNSPKMLSRMDTVLRFALGLDDDSINGNFSMYGNLTQTIMEACDPLNLAHFINRQPLKFSGGTAPYKSVLLLELMWDDNVPNQAAESLARAMGLALLEPSYRPVADVSTGGIRIEGNRNGTTGVLAQYSPAVHNSILQRPLGEVEFRMGFPFEEGDRFPEVEPFYVRNPVEPGVAQVVDFLVSARDGGPGVVEMKLGYAPIHDYDDDGYLDEDEEAAGTDASDPLSHP